MNTVVSKHASQKPLGLLALMACAALASATTARAQVIAQDNFSEGTVGSQMLGAGATGSGWADAWADKNNLDRLQSGALSYTDGLGNVLASSGNNLQSYGAASPGSSASEPERTLSATIGVDALANAADPNTVWMSYLWQGNNTTSGSGSLFRQASILFMKGASASASPNGTEYADIGTPNISTANDATVNPNISMWFANGLVPSAVPSTAPIQSTWAANTAQTYMILVEFSGTATAWSAANNAETMSVWIDPTLTGAAPVGTPDMTYTGQDLSGINGIRISGGGFNSTFGTLPGEETAGNVIFGDTAADVEPIQPVPEPATLSLAALGGLGLLAFRRRKN